MQERDTLPLYNADDKAPDDGSSAPAPMTNAERQAKWQQKRRIEIERMKRIVASAESLNTELKKHEGQQITLTLDFVSDDPETTLDALRDHLAHTSGAREQAQDVKRKRSQKKAK